MHGCGGWGTARHPVHQPADDSLELLGRWPVAVHARRERRVGIGAGEQPVLLDPGRVPTALSEPLLEDGCVLGSRDHEGRLAEVEAHGQILGDGVRELDYVSVHLDG